MSKIDDYKQSKANHEKLVDTITRARNEQGKIKSRNSIVLTLDTSTAQNYIDLPNICNEIFKELISSPENNIWDVIIDKSAEWLAQSLKEAQDEAIEFIKKS